MKTGTWNQALFAWICSIAVVGIVAEPTTAVGKNKNAQTSELNPAEIQRAPSNNQPRTNQWSKQTVEAFAKEQQLTSVAKGSSRKSSKGKPSRRKSYSSGKAKRKATSSKLAEQPVDLRPHGILEGPQRYDPRPNYRTAGVRNPYTPNLIHDHFQELDED